MHYQVRQDNFFSFKIERRYENNEDRNNKFLFNFFLFNNRRKKKSGKDERWVQYVKELKKQCEEKIKIILTILFYYIQFYIVLFINIKCCTL